MLESNLSGVASGMSDYRFPERGLSACGSSRSSWSKAKNSGVRGSAPGFRVQENARFSTLLKDNKKQ